MPVKSPYVTTSGISRSSPAHYQYLPLGGALTVASGNSVIAYVPWNARLVDVIVYQTQAGTGGTSYTVDVKTVGGTSLLSTLAVATLASGNDKVTDAVGALAVPSGWTRPVLKTDATVSVTKGARLNIVTVETGTYSPHATLQVTLVFEPLQ